MPEDGDRPSEDLRAYRFALDLTGAQLSAVRQHAGASRWAYNYALGVKFAALEARTAAIQTAVAAGVADKEARKSAPRVPTKLAIQWQHNRIKGDARTGVDGVSPWWYTVSTYAFQSAFIDADAAWKNWLDSLTGKRKGRPLQKPKFKAKHRCRDSFRIHHDVTTPTIRPDSGYRRLIVPRLGSLRVHDSTKRLCRALKRGGIVQSVTISRGGHRWYASVLVKTADPVQAVATRRQRDAGIVGVDLGVTKLAALSTGEVVDNPRHLAAGRRRLLSAQRALSRTQRGSNRRSRAARKVGRIHHQIAERRATALHTLTKRLATGWQTVAVEDLNVAGMTRSAKGTVDKPGTNVKAKSGLNRVILDASPGELRRQLAYKTAWYGSRLAVIDRWFASTQTCSACGARAKLTLADRVYRCAVCGLVMDRDVNAAINLAAQAAVAPGMGETQTARRADPVTLPPSSDVRIAVPVGAEAGRPPPQGDGHLSPATD